MRAVLWIFIVGGAVFAMAHARGPSPVAAPATRSDVHRISTTVAPASIPPSTVPSLRGDTVLTRAADGHFYTDAEVNYGRVHFLVDTGASTVALSQDDARRANVPFDPGQFQVIGTGASGPVYGQPVTVTAISVDGKRAQGIRAFVLRDSGTSLLGQAYLRQLQTVEISGDRMVLR